LFHAGGKSGRTATAVKRGSFDAYWRHSAERVRIRPVQGDTQRTMSVITGVTRISLRPRGRESISGLRSRGAFVPRMRLTPSRQSVTPGSSTGPHSVAYFSPGGR
jgi:hypothetical protein